MTIKIKSLLYKFDFIGLIPQFRILEETRYKSVFSSFLSIAVVIFSIAFVVYSFIDYLHQNPHLQYYKNNDYSTNKTYTISNSLLMFKNDFYCFSNDSDISKLIVTKWDDPGNLLYEYINYEPCELGKNLDIKYKNIIETFERVEETNISEYTCLNFNNTKFTLYDNSQISDNYERFLELRLESTCEDYILVFQLVTQNDFLEHNNRDNPIVPFYQKHLIVSMNTKTNLQYYYNYIKYESDEGFIFSDKKIFEGIGISDSKKFDETQILDDILSITFKMNGANYDYYQRSYNKFQVFVADVSSLINLIITICKILSEFLLYKKMNKDIIKNILSINENKNNNISKEKQFHKIFDNNFEIIKDKEEKKEVDSKHNDSTRSEGLPKQIKFEVISEKENNDDKITNVMKKLNTLAIIKSFFCFKDKKIKLINLCNDIIEKDICIERILKRLYLIENEFDILRNEKFFEIQNIIDNLNIGTNAKIKDKIDKESSQNNKII